ncbi:MAG: hypothetical protein AB1634_15905 [Thermodesulfobacteriota bacterium]
MKPWVKGVVIAVVHLGLVASLGVKLLYDRATRPRGWALTAPVDPDLPIRGRYVSLRLVVEPRGIPEPSPGRPRPSSQPVRLLVEDGRLSAEILPEGRERDAGTPRLRFQERQGQRLAVLEQPVAFFIPEHVPDPSRLPPGEELWVEVTLPGKGPPRPIRLGKRQGDGAITPLGLR